MNTPPHKVVQVAVAILQRADGSYLLASRPAGKGWAGWWEFPGGKLEAGETPAQALIREAQEELGITPTRIQPWLQRRYDYPATHDASAKTVLLHFFFVTDWQGELHPQEGQQFAWQHPRHLNVSPVLPANAPIMHALSLPAHYAISNVADIGSSAFLAALQRQLDQGLQVLQIHEPQLNAQALASLSAEVLKYADRYDCYCLLNDEPARATLLGFHGVHLNSQRLLALDNRPTGLMIGASCHDRSQLLHAQQWQCDYALLSPVLATRSHPQASGMGWDTLTQMISDIEIPVYALGGMQHEHLSTALACGARGIAMRRQLWGTHATH